MTLINDVMGWDGRKCDAEHPSVYRNVDGTYTCRCMVCGNCDNHTGNNTQGHFWSFCGITKEIEEPHFCCPDNCELFNEDGSKREELSGNYPSRAIDLDNSIKAHIPDSRTFVQYCSPHEGFQGTWVELTTFIGQGQGKRRLDFAWPTKLFESLSNDQITKLVVLAYGLDKNGV